MNVMLRIYISWNFEVLVVCQLSKYRIYSRLFLVLPNSQQHPKIIQLVMV